MNCTNCKTEIDTDNIDYSNNTNEEGEEYGIVSYWCPVCGEEYEFNQWGHFDNQQEAIELFIENL